MNIRSVVVYLSMIILSVVTCHYCSAAPITVTDDLGRTIVLTHRPVRLISLEPSVTEVLYAVGAGDKIVADDLYSDYPADAKTKIHVNGLGPSREMMLGLRPDLIILFDQTFTVQKADQWQSMFGVPIYVLNAGNYSQVEGDIQKLGDLAGNKAQTASIILSMDQSLAAVTKAVKNISRPKVFVLVWDRPLMTAGRGTFISDLIDQAGGVDVAAASVTGYPTYSPERLVADNPDVILTGTTGNSTTREVPSSLTGLGLKAVETNNCYAVPDDWTVRPGPRLALGLLSIAKILHPNCFTK